MNAPKSNVNGNFVRAARIAAAKSPDGLSAEALAAVVAQNREILTSGWSELERLSRLLEQLEIRERHLVAKGMTAARPAKSEQSDSKLADAA